MRYGIVNAMAEEKAALVAALVDQRVETVDGHDFHLGTIGEHEVVIVEAGIGKVAAALTTTLLLHRFQVEAVINSGSAGSLAKHLRIGDVVVADNLAYGDADARAFGYAYGQVPQQPARYAADEALSEALAVNFKNQAQGNLYRGLILTSDSFIATDEQHTALLEHFPEAYAAEMEGAAIAQVAHMYGVPFAVVRAISDNANGEAGPTFEEFIVDAGQRSAQVLIDFLTK